MKFSTRHFFVISGALTGAAAVLPVHAQVVINDTLTGASSSYNWKALNGACLTAGNNTGSIPACVGLPYYKDKTLVGGTTGRLPDERGKGALRLTNGDVVSGGVNGDNQTGAVVSNFTFPTNQGLQVTFSTVTYGGDGGTGADGISFFLSDGGKAPSVGGSGGSLGYSCSNTNSLYDGVIGAYLGIGIDEYGNFSNSGDNTSSGPGARPGRISLRGAGSTAFASLSSPDSPYRMYYPEGLGSEDRMAAIKNTCRTGTIWNYSGNRISGVNNKASTGIKLPYNYPFIQASDLPSGTISNQQAMNSPLRGNAKLITYGLKITQDGLLDFSYNVAGGTEQKVITAQPITQSNGPLPATFRFGFSAGTGGSSNVHEITCFKAAPVSQAATSAGTNVQQSSRVEAGTQVYLGFYHPINWWGELTAQDLLRDPVTDLVTVNPVANWNASCTLTGGDCQATATNITAQAPASRTMLTWNPETGAGIPFQWNSLTQAQKNSLTAGDVTASDIRLRYLRGDRTDEIRADGGKLRARTSVLGDIVNSSPTWVGPPSLSYEGPWFDALSKTAGPEGQSYAAFKAGKATRQNVVYVGANDGFLHGFRSGGYDASGKFVANATTPNDGKEVLAYMPSRVLSAIHSILPALDYSATQYSHNFYVDATPGTGDLYYGGAWRTWLVGGLGPGGNTGGPVANNTTTAKGLIYALDITDPDTFSESQASAVVKGEWTSDTLTCGNAATCGKSLGSTYGTPIIRRLHNGGWAAIFGNGFNSETGKAGIFVMIVDPTTGGASFRFLDTGYGPERSPAGDGAKNGIAYVASADLDVDHVLDYVYAGDLFGNLWRFDLTGANPDNWAASAAPIFSTPAGQPIATAPNVSSVLGIGPKGEPGVVVSFGTGRQLPQTATGAAQHASGTQALYGIWDWNLSGWNAKAAGSARYAVLTGPQTVNASTLQTQTVTATVAGSGSVLGYRTVSTNKVCWKGATYCTTGNNTKFGWTLSLPTSNEQIIFNPVTAYGMFLVNTTIPSVNQSLSCETKPASGYTMAISLGTGGAAPASFFGDANGNFVAINGGIVSGIGLSATGSPSIVSSNKWPYLVQQTVEGTPVVTKINPAANSIGSRLTWVKKR